MSKISKTGKAEKDVLKGCQKNVILIKGRESELFEEAYFIMKETERAHTSADIVAEARRIIEKQDMSAAPVSVKLNRKKKLVCFSVGMLVACLLWGAGMLFYLFM